MKNKLKVIAILLITILSFKTQAQNIILKGGYNFSNMQQEGPIYSTISDDSFYLHTESTSWKRGFNFGVAYEIAINEILYFEPNIFLSKKGFKYKDDFIEGGMDLYYLDFPLNIKAKLTIIDNMKLFILAGPYIGIGLAGNNSAIINDISNGNIILENSVSWGISFDDDLIRYELGAEFGFGMEFDKAVLEFTFDLGLDNLTPPLHGIPYYTLLKNRVLKISLGYKL